MAGSSLPWRVNCELGWANSLAMMLRTRVPCRCNRGVHSLLRRTPGSPRPLSLFSALSLPFPRQCIPFVSVNSPLCRSQKVSRNVRIGGHFFQGGHQQPWHRTSSFGAAASSDCLPPESSINFDLASEGRLRNWLPRKKCRLDELCLELYPQYSRTMIQSWILQGKAGVAVRRTATIDIIAEVPKYVCRAGYKLEAALEQFACDVKGKVALDAGLSTGGFTDCMLQNGAMLVYGVDVGYGQVAEKIRTDKRVSIMERTNLRYLPGLPQLVDLVTLDLCFISILLVLPAVCAVMKQQSTLITLIKPQFEARRSQVGGGGIVRDEAVHTEVLQKVITGVEAFGFTCQGWIPSPIKGAEGNVEFLACFHRMPELKTSGTHSAGDVISDQRHTVEVI